MDVAAKCRTIFGATTAAGLWDFVPQPPHLSDGSAAPVGFRDKPALSSRDGKGAGEGKPEAGKISAPGGK